MSQTFFARSLRDYLRTLAPNEVMRLLRSRFPHAQELGGQLLRTNLPPEEIPIRDLVKLIDHEILCGARGVLGPVRAGISIACAARLTVLCVCSTRSGRMHAIGRSDSSVETSMTRS